MPYMDKKATHAMKHGFCADVNARGDLKLSYSFSCDFRMCAITLRGLPLSCCCS